MDESEPEKLMRGGEVAEVYTVRMRSACVSVYGKREGDHEYNFFEGATRGEDGLQ